MHTQRLAVFPRQFTALCRQVAMEMQDFIRQKVIMKNSFSELGALQFARDVPIGLWGVSRRRITKPENYHRKLRDTSIVDRDSGKDSGKDKNHTMRTLVQTMTVTRKVGGNWGAAPGDQ
ncbi:hypothetical protein BGZ72_000106 [Mortierella alpina]|nr:hypothetical protein BGZ72_000106 [Mortierella alpina]